MADLVWPWGVSSPRVFVSLAAVLSFFHALVQTFQRFLLVGMFPSVPTDVDIMCKNDTKHWREYVR